jgi:uncharacterized protein
MSGLEADLAALLIAAAFVAGCLDAIAGGGGLITLPALMLAGLDPISAVATNKAQSTFGAASATYTFAKRGWIDWRKALPMAIVAFVGAILGAMVLRHLPTGMLKAGLPLLLIAVALYAGFSRALTDADARARLSPLVFTVSAVVGIGFYDGLFGPGTGSFFMLAFVTLMGFGVVRATAHAKPLNLASNLGGLVFFAFSGKILWSIGLAMGLAQIAGAQLGARLVLTHGARLVKPLIIMACLLMAGRLMLDKDNPLHFFSWPLKTHAILSIKVH